MQSFGIKVSQRNKDITTAQATEQIINSDFKTMIIVKQGTVEKTGNSGSTLVFTIRHEQNYVPFVLVYYKTSFYPTFWQWAPGIGNSSPVIPSGDKNQVVNTDVRVDRENIIVNVFLQNGASDTVSIRYFVFNMPIAQAI